MEEQDVVVIDTEGERVREEREDPAGEEKNN
eukprot:CAMPEP_0201541030 /NCGR_PEP_ID=MMETSP0161_2-20130828/71259_1 /ASSEMBLY_ACC=CAM_ASM_000251 /TAXON_ID=180227 /ORGANISM="Neoparamoeba aestuarina, Strain SoJaBio B1-5/56/2" /LENGTH=30 /DNA_ID= /DNA_START= /DNA_END= /DNA_ORIENTATION=